MPSGFKVSSWGVQEKRDIWRLKTAEVYMGVLILMAGSSWRAEKRRFRGSGPIRAWDRLVRDGKPIVTLPDLWGCLAVVGRWFFRSIRAGAWKIPPLDCWFRAEEVTCYRESMLRVEPVI